MNNAMASSSAHPVKTVEIMHELPIPRVSLPPVVNYQKHAFQNDELLKKLSVRNKIRYGGNVAAETKQLRQISFRNECYSGSACISFAQHGINLDLTFVQKSSASGDAGDGCDFSRDPGIVHIVTPLLMNGVCVKFRGWIHLKSLHGVGLLEYDEQRALIERQKLHEYSSRRSEMGIIHEFRLKQLAIDRGWIRDETSSQYLNRPEWIPRRQ